MRALIAAFLTLLIVHESFATITKMNGGTITTSTKLNGAARAKACGVAIASSGGNALFSGRSGTTSLNNFFGELGCKFVPNANMTITAVGRWKISGSNLSHTVRIINSVGTTLGSAVVDFSSGGTAGAWNYTTLGSPISLTSGSTYYIMSTETSGGDFWYDDTNGVTLDSHFGSLQAYYVPNGGGLTANTLNACYVPVNFQFTIP